MVESLRLLRSAARMYDDPGGPLACAAAAARGFASGAVWMRVALMHVRERDVPPVCGRFRVAGILKYLAACGAALVPIVAAAVTGWWWLVVLAIPAFYAVEVQMLFLFPLMLDGHPRAVRRSFYLTRCAGGTVYAVVTVLPIAAFMLGGALFGCGIRRSWCIGCLAVCLWYEQARHELPHLRQERFSDFHLRKPVTVLFAADLHLGWPWTRRAACSFLRAARETRPDLILLGGDLLDRCAALPRVRRLVSRLTTISPVYVTPGNHDRRFAGLAAVVREAGAWWLPDGAVAFWTAAGECLTITATPAPREAAVERQVLCAHDPAVGAEAAAPLVFAGHLHGGQCVLATWRGRLFPGYFFNRLTVLRRVSGEAALFVSRGMGDSLPLRWNCPHEVIVCRVG